MDLTRCAHPECLQMLIPKTHLPHFSVNLLDVLSLKEMCKVLVLEDSPKALSPNDSPFVFT